ncbi:MAG: metal-dependent phosphoesterase, partial [Candidatus Aenigmatarchaeota archaeon]
MKYDLHTHTYYSRHWFWKNDGISSPKNVVKAAILKGLDGVAITDHNTVKGSLKALKYARGKIDIVTGLEVRSRRGDILALGVKEDIPPMMDVEETVERIHELGGVAVAAHPFAPFPRICLRGEVLKHPFDAIEAFNSGNLGEPNKKAIEFAKTHNLTMTAGSDAHYWKDVGLAYTVVDDDPIEAIRKGKTK